mgnify:CR=1 FL=1
MAVSEGHIDFIRKLLGHKDIDISIQVCKVEAGYRRITKHRIVTMFADMKTMS